MDPILPDPMTPPGCDLRNFAYMPLDVLRLRDSDLAAVVDPEGFRCAVLLWCAAWHQVPAASLPADDATLARLAGYGRDIRAFRRARDAGGMKGWILCSDGRYYHGVVAEKANSAFLSKQKQRIRTAAATAARFAKVGSESAEESKQPPEKKEYKPDVTLLVTDNVTSNVTSTTRTDVTFTKGDKRNGEERKKDSISEGADGESTKLPSSRGGKHATGVQDPDFDTFWRIYPRRVGKHAAQKAWPKALRIASAERIIDAVRVYPWALELNFIPHPATWLNDQRWNDDPAAVRPGSAPSAAAGPITPSPARTASGRVLTVEEAFQVLT